METGTLIIVLILAGLCIAFSGKNVFKNSNNGGNGGSKGGSSNIGGGE